MIVVDRAGTRWTGTSGDWQRMKDQVRGVTGVHLPGFLHPALLQEVRGLLAKTRFSEQRHSSIGVDECADAGPLSALMLLLLNDRALIEQVEDLTGARIDGFQGRVYRMRAGAGHFDSWHSDARRGRRAAISININEARVPTAPLQIRRSDADSTLFEFANAMPGDAVLFRLDDEHVHRVMPMAGAADRVAYAGWFYEGPGLAARLREEAHSSSTRSKT